MNKKGFFKLLGLCAGLSLAVGAGVAAVGSNTKAVDTRAAETVLTFSLTSNPGGWPTSNSTTATNYTYTLDNVAYTFNLKNVKQNSGYLMLTSTASLGLPAIEGKKLSQIVASNSGGCSTSTKVGVSSSNSTASYIDGGAIQTWSTTNSTYTYNLTSTSENTVYYLYVTNKNCQITQLKLTYSSQDAALSDISLDGSYKTSFTVGDTFSFGGTVTAHYEGGGTADVTSSATFSGYNMSAAGNYTVTVSYTEGETTKTATYGITVSEPVKVSSLEIDESATLQVYGTTSLTATILPTDAANKTLSWSSSDETVATVEGGTVTAIKVGSTTITASTTDGSNLSSTCDVTVTEPDYYKLTASISPFSSASSSNTAASDVTLNGIQYLSKSGYVYNSSYLSFNKAQNGANNAYLYNNSEYPNGKIISKIVITLRSEDSNFSDISVYQGTTAKPSGSALTVSASGNVGTYSFSNNSTHFSIVRTTTGSTYINMSEIAIYLDTPANPKFNVKFDSNGGSLNPEVQQVESGSTITFPDPGTKTYYSFLGWSCDEGENLYDIGETSPEIEADTAFVAYWEAEGDIWDVTFNSNGGSINPEAIEILDGETFVLPSPGTKANHSFLGWSCDGGENKYDAGKNSPIIEADTTFVAYWQEAEKFSISYLCGENGTGSTVVVSDIYDGTEITLKTFAECSFTANEGYSFKCWKIGDDEYGSGAKYTVNGDVTVEAIYKGQSKFGLHSGALVEGDYIIVSDGAAMNTTVDGNRLQYTDVTVSNDRITTNDTNIIWHIAPSGDYWTIYNTAAGKYAAATNVKNAAQMLSDGTDDKSLWACESNADSTDYDFENKARASGSDPNNKWLRKNGTYGFAAYASGTGSKLKLYKEVPMLDSVTTSGQTDTFNAGEQFDYDGTLTAHYTLGKANTTVEPTDFKYGEAGINPISSGTVIDADTTLLVNTHNGKYIYLIYTEDGITKYTSYKITVNVAPATSVTIDPNAKTSVGINEHFIVSDIDVTVNPSAYTAQGVTWEIYNAGDLVENVTYFFNGDEFYATIPCDAVVFHVKSNQTPSVYASFTLKISGEPGAYLLDGNNTDVTDGSIDLFEDAGTVGFSVSTENFAGTISYTWSSSNTSVISIDDERDDECDFYVEGISGSATLSCHVTGTEKGDITVSVDVSVTSVSITAVSWAEPTINVFTGDDNATITSSMVSGWNVKYNTNSGKTNLTPDSFNVKLGGSTITLPYALQASDHGKTLCVEYGGVSSTTTTVSVTQRLNAINKETFSENTSNLTFSEACKGSGKADDNATWTVTSDGTESSFDAGKGIHYGTGSAAVQYIKLASSSFVGAKISRVVVNASTASGVSATASVKVGDKAFGGDAQSLSTSAADYTFNGNATGGDIEVLVTKASSATKALYCKSIVVTYETSNGTEQIANVLAHAEAQRAVVKFAQAFNAAMDETENCTTGMDTAWAACQEAYDTFKTDAASDLDYAKSLLNNATRAYSDDSPEACVERMMRTYEICVNTHGRTAFMSDLVTLGSAPRSNPINALVNGDNTMPIIVIVSLLSISAVGGYLFLRRRNEQ